MTDSKGSGPTPDDITRWITATWPETIVAQAMGATFFSLDPSNWPNFATIVTTDEHDLGAPSNLTARPDVFRLNIGVGKGTFERLVAAGFSAAPDHAALDRLLPHPVYAKQRWISILNPSRATFDDPIKPLLTEAHDRIAKPGARARQR
jgi:hypothetical protein